MARQLTWYDILDLLPGASAEDVQRAVTARESALRPELISGAPSQVVAAAGRARAAVEAARRILTDPASRQRYDDEIGTRRAGGGLSRAELVPSQDGGDRGWGVMGDIDPGAALTLGVLADWLAPHAAPPRRIAVADVRGLFARPCRRLIAGNGLHIKVVRLTQDPMPVEGLVVDQSPLPGATVRRSSTVTVQLWHPPRRSGAGGNSRKT